MTFKVNPSEIRAFAAELGESYADVEAAKNYTHAYGDFSFHQAGIIGTLAGQHAGLMHQLDEMHNRLLTILQRSQEALTEIADRYDDTDVSSAARVDATYPDFTRPVLTRDR